jgi:ketosteroid isomerase-like protein
MTAEGKKRAAMALVENAGQGNLEAVVPLISDDFVLEQMVRQPEGDYSASGTRYDRESYLGFLGLISQMTRTGMNITFDLTIAEGDNVALFGKSDAVSPQGRIYRNAYCWHLAFAGSRICLMREFYDTALGDYLLQG